MIFSLDTTKSSSSHLDLLRLLIDVAALIDRRTALKLALLSKTTQAWVEPIVYAEVNLHDERSGRGFLRTLRNSKTKPPSFFARHVKSLIICSDVGSQVVVEILSVCRGVINFSYWATPRPSTRQCTTARFETISGQEPDIVAPQRMSVLLHENHIYPLKPYFHLSFFSSVTHLSILNNWEEWTTWTHISSEEMPTLTHIKFDMNVQRSRRRRVIQGVQNSELTFTKNDRRNQLEVLPTSGSLWLDIKISRVANALTEVLNNNDALRVCILVLRFDADPNDTAKCLAIHTLIGDRVLVETDVSAATWFDPRLVFAHERQPLRYCYAHSKHEMNLWKSAEAVVNTQRHMTGYTLLDCGT